MMNYKYNIMHNVLKHLRLPLQAEDWCSFLNRPRPKPTKPETVMRYTSYSLDFCGNDIQSVKDSFCKFLDEIEESLNLEDNFRGIKYLSSSDDYPVIEVEYATLPSEADIIEYEKKLYEWQQKDIKRELVESTYNSYVDNGFKFK